MTSSEPVLSIIVTSYNVESYLEHSLRTIVDQTYSNLEIIVVDDGSTDRSPEIITEFAERDARVVPLLLPTNSIGGVATAANAGIERATGEYIGFADGDDVYEPVMFERLMAAALAGDTDLAMCNYRLLDDKTGLLSNPADNRRWSELPDTQHFDLNVDRRKQLLRFVAVPWRKIYRRSLLIDNGIRFPVGDYFYEDNPFHWSSILSARDIAIVPESLCYHRVARAGQTMQTVDEKVLRIFAHHATIREWLLQHGLLSTYGDSLFGWVVSQLEWISARTPRALRRDLFRTVQPIVAGYDVATVERALRDGEKGDVTWMIVGALVSNSLADFNRVLDTRGAPSSVAVKTAYHLRYGGIRETARIGRRYAAQRGLPVGSPPDDQPSLSDIGLETDGAVRNKDLLFALVLLEKRLEALEQRLASGDDAGQPGRTDSADGPPTDSSVH